MLKKKNLSRLGRSFARGLGKSVRLNIVSITFIPITFIPTYKYIIIYFTAKICSMYYVFTEVVFGQTFGPTFRLKKKKRYTALSRKLEILQTNV